MNIKAISAEQHADIISAATITSAINHSGMIAHQAQHPELGKVAVIQGHGDGAILVSMPE